MDIVNCKYCGKEIPIESVLVDIYDMLKNHCKIKRQTDF